jgi:hypothetical protein
MFRLMIGDKKKAAPGWSGLFYDRPIKQPKFSCYSTAGLPKALSRYLSKAIAVVR